MQDKLRGAFQPALPFCCSMGSFTAFSTSTNLHPPPPSSRTSSAHAVASTLGNGGTSRNHSPASRECLSTRSEEHTSELQSRVDLVCRLLLEKKKHRRQETIQLDAELLT